MLFDRLKSVRGKKISATRTVVFSLPPQPSILPPPLVSSTRNGKSGKSSISHRVQKSLLCGFMAPLDRWTEGEVLILVSAWLNTSVDPIIGNSQKAESFWKLIASSYSEGVKTISRKERDSEALRKKWRTINVDVQSFSGIHDKINRQYPSGHNSYDLIELALKQYRVEHRKPFTYLEAWKVLRDQPKWMMNVDNSSNKKRKIIPDCGSSSVQYVMHPPVEDQEYSEPPTMERPIGQKKAKKQKLGDSSSVGFSEDKRIVVASMQEKIDVHNNEFVKFNGLLQRHVAVHEAQLKIKAGAELRELLNMDASRMNEFQMKFYGEACARALSNMVSLDNRASSDFHTDPPNQFTSTSPDAQ